MVALPLLKVSADMPFSAPLYHLHLFSVGFGDMSVHIEVPGDFWKGELNAVKLPSENDLTSQPGVLLKHRRHVQHVILPRTPGYVNLYSNLCFHVIAHSR